MAPAKSSPRGGIVGRSLELTNAAETIAYLGGLTIGQGRLAGQPFRAMGWQRRFCRGALAPGVAEACLTLGRGGGKSTLIAGIGCAALDGPLMQPEAEILIVASSHEQGQIIFRHVLRFLAPEIEAGRFRVADTVNTSRLVNRATGTMLSVKGSDPKRLHGAAPALICADEIAQWPTPRIGEMLAALRTASGKIPDARLLMIGTRPADELHPFAVALRDADYRQVHAAGPDDPPFQRRTWKKANPGLDAMPDLEQAIRREAKAAKRDPALMAQFRALRLNQGVDDAEVSVLLDAGVWASIEGSAEREGPAVWGVDLGASAAQSAVAVYYPQTGALACLAAFPAEPNLCKRGLRDGCGGLYLECARRGELVTLGGRSVPIPELLAVALERFGRPARVVADRWREAELRDALDAAGVPLAALEFRGQGFKDGAEDVRAYRRACLEGRVTPEPSLLLRSAMAEARTISDPAGNAKLSKGSQGGRRLRARDDAAAAAILAVAAGVRQPVAPRPRWRYRGMAG